MPIFCPTTMFWKPMNYFVLLGMNVWAVTGAKNWK